MDQRGCGELSIEDGDASASLFGLSRDHTPTASCLVVEVKNTPREPSPQIAIYPTAQHFPTLGIPHLGDPLLNLAKRYNTDEQGNFVLISYPGNNWLSRLFLDQLRNDAGIEKVVDRGS